MRVWAGLRENGMFGESEPASECPAQAGLVHGEEGGALGREVGDLL